MDPNVPPPDDADLPAVIHSLTERAASEDLGSRRSAFEGLYELAYKAGPKAAGAIPVLIEGLFDPDPQVGERASWALNYCKPHSIEPLIECLAHPLESVRERAAHALGNIGEEAMLAAPALRRLLADESQPVRSRAAWALGLLKDADPQTLAPLARLLSQGTVNDRSSAMHAIGNLGKATDGPAAIDPYRPLILDSLDDPYPGVRRWAIYAAESLEMDAQEAAELMVSLIHREAVGEVMQAALARLKTLAPLVDLAGTEPRLAELVETHGREAALACEVLASMRPRPTQATDVLRRALGVDDMVLPAAAALWKIEGSSEPLLPALERIFDDYGESVCDLVCELGPAAAPLLPRLIRALAEEDWDLQWAAADALGAVASSQSEVMTVLLDALMHPSPIVRSAASKALARLGGAAVPALRQVVADGADRRAPWAAFALGEMGAVAAEALGELRVGMRDGKEPLSGCCAIAVAQIAGDADSVPYLVGLLSNNDSQAPRRAAVRALAEVGPAALAAVAALEALLEDDDFDVQQAAEEALAAIQGRSH